MEKLKLINNIINNKKVDKKNEKNYGIDLLRIFSMIQVIILHLIMYSVGNKIEPSNKKYQSVWCLESICTCSVNNFALISGVVGYKSYKFRNLIYLWFHIFFYSFIIEVIYLKIRNKNINYFNIKIFNNMFPILIKREWYHQLNNGFSALWLIILYIIGSFFGKYIINNNFNENINYFSKWIIFFLSLTIFNYKLHLILIKKKKILGNLFLKNI